MQMERYPLSLPRKKTVNPIVTASVTGAASQTPLIPKTAGSTKILKSSTTSPRDDEITADSKARPVAVK